MNGVEVMTSESQERMLAIVTPAHLDEVLALCRRWEIRASVIGRVTSTGRFRVYDGETILADVPAGSLGDGPVYDRPLARPSGQDALVAADPAPTLLERFGDGADLGPELLGLLGSPGVADSSWVWRQYDHQLFLNTVAGPGSDAAVLRVKETGGGLALSTDGKARYCLLDPFTGAALAVLEGARNVACAGARPMAVVNCLNFGNPEHPEVMWQFSEVVDGMSAACRALGVPVVGGNVSFYNTSDGADIHPTPVVGTLGLMDRLEEPPPTARLAAGERIVLLGSTGAEFGGSEWAMRHGLLGGPPPAADLEAGAALCGLVAGLVGDGLVAGIHDCSDGGLAVALAEMAIAGDCGFRVGIDGLPAPVACFSESSSRVVLSLAPDQVAAVLARAEAAGVPALDIGEAGGGSLTFSGAFTVPVAEAASAWRNGLPVALAG